MHSPINVVMKQQRDGAIIKCMGIHRLACKPARAPACPPSCLPAVHPVILLACRQTAPPTGRLKYNMERHGIKRGSALDFRQQDGQQMYNNEKMFDFLYFSEE